MAAEIQYVADEEGNTVAAIVPIELWREIESERETAYLLKSNLSMELESPNP
jgi:antitoxin YefM